MIVLAKHWWSFLVRGLIAVLVGIVTFLAPGLTLGALVILFGAYALVDGVLSIVAAWRASRSQERWSMLLLEGLAGILAAVVTMAWPAITAVALIYLVAAWAIVTGVFEVVTAIRLRKYISGEWLLALVGIASILFGFMIMIAPIAGALVIALWIGVYAFVFGIMLIALSFRLRKWTRGHHDAATSMPLPA